MERALIVASFGAGAPEARSAVTAVEEALRRGAPGYGFVRVFTSPAVRRILAGRGERVPGLTEALEALRSAGTRRVLVQPTHLLRGVEYDRLKAEAEAFSGDFEALDLGRPLLADAEDVRRFANRLGAAHPAREGAVTVFLGHGTEGLAGAVYPALQTGLRLEGREDLLVGAVKGWPTLDDVLRQLEPGGPRRIELVPLMLTAGYHAQKDMAGVWKPRLERAGHRVACSFIGLGERSWVRRMYRERLDTFFIKK